MGDMPSTELAMSKPQAKQKERLMASKAKKGSVLSAIEDIQRLPTETICQEFDRLVENTQRHFRKEALMPCTDVATKLQNCLQSHRQQSYNCFNVMDEYRQCVAQATQEHIDHLATKYAEATTETMAETEAEAETEAIIKAKADANADEDQRQLQQKQPPMHALPMVPPQSVPAPAMSVESSRHRLWYKPWSWLR